MRYYSKTLAQLIEFMEHTKCSRQKAEETLVILTPIYGKVSFHSRLFVCLDLLVLITEKKEKKKK